jgi:hypothetical protein
MFLTLFVGRHFVKLQLPPLLQQYQWDFQDQIVTKQTGIRLFNKECGKGGEGIDDCKSEVIVLY